MVRILCKRCLCKHCRRIRVGSRTLKSVDEALNNQLLKALGQRIRELRSEKGYSQEAFADHCGVHRTFMGTVERGESNLSFANIAKVAAALEIPLSTLFLEVEVKAEILAAAARAAADKTGKHRRTSKRAR